MQTSRRYLIICMIIGKFMHGNLVEVLNNFTRWISLNDLTILIDEFKFQCISAMFQLITAFADNEFF